MPRKILALLLCLLGVCMLWTPGAQAAGEAPETWPTETFAQGRGPWWLSGPLTRLVYLMKGRSPTKSLLILREGELIYEHYNRKSDETTAFDIYSVTKSVVATLTGIAVYEGAITSLDQKVIDFFPEAQALLPADSNKRDMTVDHLITMKSGLDPALEDTWQQSADSGLGAFLSAQKYAPGTTYEYVGPSFHLLACLVSRAVGMPLLDYANEKLFGPLGITSVQWNRWPDGSYIGPSEISMTARDMLRLGYLWLHDGRWEDKQLLAADFITQARPTEKNGYGRSFWNNEVGPFTLKNSFEAAGWGGQYISIFPSSNMIIVRTGGW